MKDDMAFLFILVFIGFCYVVAEFGPIIATIIGLAVVLVVVLVAFKIICWVIRAILT